MENQDQQPDNTTPPNLNQNTPQQALPPQPVTGSAATLPPTKKSKKKLIISLTVVLVVIIAGAGVLYALHNNSSNSNTKNTQSQTKSTKQTTVSQSNVSPAYQYVNIPEASDSSSNSNCSVNQMTGPTIGSGEVQSCVIYVASGHYLYIYQNNSSQYAAIYDGKAVSISQQWLAAGLSQNGLHYYYYDSSSGDVYVDGNNLGSTQGIQNPKIDLANIWVSNDGKTYAYESTAGVEAKFYKNDSLFADAGDTNGNLVFDGNLTNYIEEESIQGTPNESFKIIYNGKTVYTSPANSGSAGVNLAISPNGQHYGYSYEDTTNNNNVNVTIDNNQVGTFATFQTPTSCVLEPDKIIVADSGDYAYAYCNESNGKSGVFQFDKTTYNISPYDSYTFGVQGFNGLSSDGKHIYWTNQAYGLGTSNNQYLGDSSIYLDGKALSLSGNIVGVGFNGDTLDIYRLSQN